MAITSKILSSKIIPILLLLLPTCCFSQTKRNYNYQNGNNIRNTQTINITNYYNKRDLSKKTLISRLEKSKELISFISRRDRKIKILILPFYFRGPSNLEPSEKFEAKLYTNLKEVIDKDTLNISIVKINDYKPTERYSSLDLQKLKDSSKINLIIFGSYDRNNNGDIVNCNWLSDSIRMHLPSIFPDIDSLYYQNNMTSSLFNEEYNMLDYRKNKSLRAPLFVTFFSLGIKLPFYEHQTVADNYFDKAFQFASTKEDSLSIFRFKIITDAELKNRLFYCDEILKENRRDSLILFYKYRSQIELKLYREALNTSYDLSKFYYTNPSEKVLYIAGIYWNKAEADSCIFYLREGIKLSYMSLPDNDDRYALFRKTCIELSMKAFMQVNEFDSVLKCYELLTSDAVIKDQILKEIKYQKTQTHSSWLITSLADNIFYPVGMALLNKERFSEAEAFFKSFTDYYETVFDVFYSDPLTKEKLNDPWFILGKHYLQVGDLQKAKEFTEHSILFLKKRVKNKNLDISSEMVKREELLKLSTGN